MKFFFRLDLIYIARNKKIKEMLYNIGKGPAVTLKDIFNKYIVSKY
jgi:hypothetical protein